MRFYNNALAKVKPRPYTGRINGIRVQLYDFGDLPEETRRQLTVFYRNKLNTLVRRTKSIQPEQYNFQELETLDEIYGAYAWLMRHVAITRSLYLYKLLLMAVFVGVEFLFKLFIPMDGFVLAQVNMLDEYEDLLYDWSERQGTGRRGKGRGDPLMSLVKAVSIQMGIYMVIGLALKYLNLNLPQSQVYDYAHGFIEKLKSGSEEEAGGLLKTVAKLLQRFTGGNSNPRSATRTPASAQAENLMPVV